MTEPIDPRALTDDELAALLDEARTEYQRRHNLTAALEAAPELAAPFLESLGREPGATWVQPLGDFDAYPLGWEVLWDDRLWVSTTDGNVWEPGVSGWREVPADGGAPVWVQPTGAHDAYKAGDTVTHNSAEWTSNIDGNVWEPGVYGWTQNT